MSAFTIEVRDAETRKVIFSAHRVKSDKFSHLLGAYIASRAETTGSFHVKFGIAHDDDAIAAREGVSLPIHYEAEKAA